jgi:hypothetical protein
VIHIPLARLLDRLADQIDSADLHPDTDPYDRAQLQAAAEILRNLAPRVQWRVHEDEAEAVRALLAAGDVDPAAGPAMDKLAAAWLDRELGNLRR